MADKPNVLFLDSGALIQDPVSRNAVREARCTLTYTLEWHRALDQAAAAPVDLILVSARAVNAQLADLCAALRSAHPAADTPIVLIVSDKNIDAYPVEEIDCVSWREPPANWRTFMNQISLEASHWQRLRNQQRLLVQDASTLETLEAAGCHIDAQLQSCELSYRLIRLLGLTRPGHDKDQSTTIHWRGLLSNLEREDQDRLQTLIIDALNAGRNFRTRCVLKVEPRHVLICVGMSRRGENGQVVGVDISWQRHSATTTAAIVPMKPNLTAEADDANALPESIERRIQSQASGSLLFIQLLNYNELCKTLGYFTGQRVLTDLCAQVSSQLRGKDLIMPQGSDGRRLVTRIGGAEIIAILNGVADERSLARIKARVMGSIRPVFEYNGRSIPLKIATGEAIWPQDGVTTEELISNAALTANFRSKTTGQSSLAPDASLEQARDAIRLEADLYDAVLNQELVLHYQPKYSLADGGIVGMEALLRWHHHHSRWIPPSDFIPIAERNGLINSIGAWVMDEAIRFHARLYSEGYGRIPISVNMSAEQLLAGSIVLDTVANCQAFSVPTEHIEIEVTESCLIDDPERAIEVLTAFRNAGFTIALDDFGTGFSSLSYLRTLPLDVLKIDRSFVSALTTDNYDPGLIACIIGLGLTLGLRIVAEGIETEAQWQLLGEWGCHDGQGFLMSRPLPEDQITTLLKDQSRRNWTRSA